MLAGSASELERDLPFGVFVDAVDAYVESLDPRRLERLDGDVRAELARVFPALTSFGGDGAQALQNERYRAHRAVRTLLEVLATKPTLLVLDDFHWADSASIELTGALLRRPPAAPVLLVLAFRPRQLPGRLAAELSRAERNDLLTRIELAPLSAPAARELLGTGSSEPPAAQLYEESGGVPFYLEQLARVSGDGRGGQAWPAAAPSCRNVPSMVQRRCAEELMLLSDGARRLLQGAAVAGDPFEPELAAAAAGVTEAEAIDGARRAAGARLRPPDRRPAALPVPPPARPPGRLRVSPGRLAAGRARAQPPRRSPGGPRPPRRGPTTSSAPARPGDADAVALLVQRRRAGRRARARDRRALVRRRAAAAATRALPPRSACRSCCAALRRSPRSAASARATRPSTRACA